MKTHTKFSLRAFSLILTLSLFFNAKSQSGQFDRLNTLSQNRIPRYSSIANANAAGAASGNIVNIYAGVDSGVYVRSYDNTRWIKINGAGGSSLLPYKNGNGIKIVGDSILSWSDSLDAGTLTWLKGEWLVSDGSYRSSINLQPSSGVTQLVGLNGANMISPAGNVNLIGSNVVLRGSGIKFRSYDGNKYPVTGSNMVNRQFMIYDTVSNDLIMVPEAVALASKGDVTKNYLDSVLQPLLQFNIYKKLFYCCGATTVYSLPIPINKVYSIAVNNIVAVGQDGEYLSGSARFVAKNDNGTLTLVSSTSEMYSSQYNSFVGGVPSSSSQTRIQAVIYGDNVVIQFNNASNFTYTVTAVLKIDDVTIGAGTGNLILDQYPAAAAYSFLKLRTLYTGPVIRAFRQNDSTYRDIPFYRGQLDKDSLLRFAGSNTVKIGTWYDQAGSNNISNTDTSRMPIIVKSGVLVTVNALPAAEFDYTKNMMLWSTYPAPSHNTLLAIASNWTAGATVAINRTATIDYNMHYSTTSTSSTITFRYNSGTALNGPVKDWIQNLYVTNFDSTTYSFYLNGQTAAIDSGARTVATGLTAPYISVGGKVNGVSGGVATVANPGSFFGQTFIAWNTNVKPNLSTISNSVINSHNSQMAWLPKTIVTPDASGGATGKGFTITGLTFDEYATAARNDGKIVMWVGNHGRSIDTFPSNNQATIVKLLIDLNAADYSTAEKLDEIMFFQNPNVVSPTTASIQGVSEDQYNTLWIATNNGYIYNFSKDGTYLSKFYRAAANALAYDKKRNRIMIKPAAQDSIVIYDRSGNYITRFSTSAAPSFDQMFFDEATDYIYVSRGANGNNGTTNIFDVNGNVITKPYNVGLSRVKAAEGITIRNGLLFFGSDGFYHKYFSYPSLSPAINPPDDINAIHIYRIR